VETTGLNANKHAIIQLAYIIEINGKVKQRGSFRINPKTYNQPKVIEPAALEANGLSLEQLDLFNNSSECFEQFRQVLEKYISTDEKLTFVAYNSPFDIKFVQAWFMDNNRRNDYGRYFTYKDLDIFALVKYLAYAGPLRDLPSHKLSEVCKYFDINFDAHDAVADIEATRDLHLELMNYICKGD
jgi:DNA polymerase III alpha subunit (gram-positive type)